MAVLLVPEVARLVRRASIAAARASHSTNAGPPLIAAAMGWLLLNGLRGERLQARCPTPLYVQSPEQFMASVNIYPRAILSSPGSSRYSISYNMVLRAVLQKPLRWGIRGHELSQRANRLCTDAIHSKQDVYLARVILL